jgi:hypothetical protein
MPVRRGTDCGGERPHLRNSLAAELPWPVQSVNQPSSIGLRHRMLRAAVTVEETAAFEMVKIETVFEFAVIVFDAPVDLRRPDKVPQPGVGGAPWRQPVVGGFWLAEWPFESSRQSGRVPSVARGDVAAVSWRRTSAERPSLSAIGLESVGDERGPVR